MQIDSKVGQLKTCVSGEFEDGYYQCTWPYSKCIKTTLPKKIDCGVDLKSKI